MGQARDDSPWLGRYRAPFPIRARGKFHLLAAERADGAGARVVVVAAPSAESEAARRALGEFARVHAMLEHPTIPRAELLEHAGQRFVELDCDAVADGHELLRLTAEADARFSYGQGDALFTLLRTAMQTAHAVTDPTTGHPVCLGRVCYGNFLFARTGRVFIVGFGHNVALARENGAPDGTCAVFQAPEIAIGARPSPSADYVATLLAARSLISFADVTAITRRIAEKNPFRPENFELLQLVRYFETRWVSESPDARPPIDEGIRSSMRIREIIGTSVDIEGLERAAAALIDAYQPAIDLPDEPWPAPGALTVARDGSWAEGSDGARRRLGRGTGGILVALAECQLRDRAAALDVWTLLDAGWPGEAPIPEAGANRVYVALTRLRNLGFRGVVQRHGAGYRIDPGVRVRVV